MPLIVLLGVLASVIPGEVVPRIDDLANGDREYVFQSFRESVLWPVGAVLLVLLVAISTRVLRYRKRPASPEPSPEALAQMPFATRAFRVARRLSRRSLLAVLFAGLAMCFLLVTLFTPLASFRTVRVTKSTAVFNYLWLSHEVELRDIKFARMEERRDTIRRRECVVLRVVAVEKSGIEQLSVGIRMDVQDPLRPAYERTMAALVTALEAKK